MYKFKEMMDIYASHETITIEEIIDTELKTRGQSSNQLWKELKQRKLTASNFGKAVKRKTECTLRITQASLYCMLAKQMNKQMNTMQ
jgi:hypothetical protein